MVYVYALKLENNKYYIGKTNNPNFRLDQHFNSNGSQWTKLHKPLKLKQMNANCDEYDEDKLTRMYMDKYGIDNVRGGSFVQLNFDENTIKFLNKMQNSAKNECFKCGKSGHFANYCPQKNKANATPSKHRTFPPKRPHRASCIHPNTPKMKNNDIYQIWTCDYCLKEFNTLRGASYHQNFHCKLKMKHSNGYISYDDDDDDDDDKQTYYQLKTIKSNKCFKCGRTGHYSDSCYANKHVKGYYLE